MRVCIQTDISPNTHLVGVHRRKSGGGWIIAELPNDRLNVNMPVQNPAGSFALALAKLPLGTLLELELSAAQIEGRGEVVSSPRVITADSHTARIEQGVEIPFLELDDGDATLKFRKAVLSLEVTPQITPDDRVIMDLDVHKDSVGENVSFGGNLSAPSIDTREVQSQLLVDNGQKPDVMATIADITCDSDGEVSSFVGEHGRTKYLPLHKVSAEEDYYIGEALQELSVPLLKIVKPGISDLWAYPETGFHPLAAVAV